jgi:hypothetical protein
LPFVSSQNQISSWSPQRILQIPFSSHIIEVTLRMAAASSPLKPTYFMLKAHYVLLTTVWQAHLTLCFWCRKAQRRHRVCHLWRTSITWDARSWKFLRQIATPKRSLLWYTIPADRHPPKKSAQSPVSIEGRHSLKVNLAVLFYSFPSTCSCQASADLLI